MTRSLKQLVLPLAGIAWIGGFLWLFFTIPLPNVAPAAVGLETNAHAMTSGVNRAEIWRQFYPGWHSLPNPLDFDTTQMEAVESGWQFLPQRLPFLLTAGLLLLVAFAMGGFTTCRLLVGIDLSRCERLVIRAGVGLSALSLWVLAAARPGLLSRDLIVLPGVVAAIGWGFLCRRKSAASETATSTPESRGTRTPFVLTWLLLAPFIIMLILGAMTPPWDFDVREYHMQGPKEWFLAGQITFLEHNVYTSFPFLSEMLSLASMTLHDDWRTGAISSKLLLATFQLLTTLCVFASATRWFGRNAGLIAAIVYLTTPWTFRISIIAYAEGALTFYLAASVMTALLAGSSAGGARTRLWFVTGLLAGSAMAAKYPGVLSVVIPVGLFLLAATCRSRVVTASGDVISSETSSRSHRRHTTIRTATVFGAAVLIAVGPWLVKNAIDTGNPVYPLLYDVFGGVDWNSELNARWKAGHSAVEHDVTQIPRYLSDVAIRSDWTSGLLFGLAVPSLLLWRRFYSIRWVWLMTVWMLATWWALTHRIDRFWIPVIPVLAVLAGASWHVFPGWPGRAVVVAALTICSVFNLGFWKIPRLAGFQIGLMDLTAGRQIAVRQDFRLLNRMIPSNGRALMVGEAEVFDAEFGVVYNTVFDESIFERWTQSAVDMAAPARTRHMATPEAIAAMFQERGITHVVVNWSEILRYRQPGSYGFTEYVQPRRFSELVEVGVLEPATTLTYGDWERLSAADQNEILSWEGGRSLIMGNAWTSIQVHRVAGAFDTSGSPSTTSP